MKTLFYLLILTAFSFSSGVSEDNPQPNIIFIMADDMGYGDLGCYGQKLIKTPNIDKLASQGIRFLQAYAGGAVCTPSRGSLMTGLHNGHSPARDNVPHYPTYLEENDVTVAEVLKQAGYRCGGVGKWSLGDAGTVGRATNQGFDSWFGYLNKTSGEVIAFQDMLPTFAELAGTVAPEYLDGISVVEALEGKKLSRPHKSLYWDYGHCRGKSYSQAVRMDNWKGIRPSKTGMMELYDLSEDIGERHNLAPLHPDIVRKISTIMDEAVTPNPRYEIGTVYKGGPIWKKSH